MYKSSFRKLTKGENTIPVKNLHDFIIHCGLTPEDGRISDAMLNFNQNPHLDIDEERFLEAAKKNDLFRRIFANKLVVPEWTIFSNKIKRIYNLSKELSTGTKSDLTPILQRADERIFGVSICTIDGQSLNLGDTRVDFCAMSGAKILSYLMAVEEHGSEYVHQFVGKEPSGTTFNTLTLKEVPGANNNVRYIPHNPFTDAGAILCSSLIGNDQEESKRFFKVSEVYRKATNSAKIGFNHESFLYERKVSDLRSCLGYMLRECKSFPLETNVATILELYFQLRSLEINCEQAAVFAATLANGGICPLNNEALFDPDNVRDCLSLMLSCGVYDFSGEWAFKIGLPAKSASSGLILIVIPNKMGIAVYSPLLDEKGNSARAIDFAERLVDGFCFHQLDNNRGFGEGSKSQPCQLGPLENEKPRLSRSDSMDCESGGASQPNGAFSNGSSFCYLPNRSESSNNLASLMNAAETGDLDEIRGLMTDSVDLMQMNYDHRTALHLAASKGFADLVGFLAHDENGKVRDSELLSRKDRWGLTPLDVAEGHGFDEVADILRKCGGKRGSELEGE